MIKWLMLLIFMSLITVCIFYSDDLRVNIGYWPSADPINMHLGTAVGVFTAVGLLMGAILAIIDRLELVTRMSKLRRDRDRLEKELVSLRELVTMEREE